MVLEAALEFVKCKVGCFSQECTDRAQYIRRAPSPPSSRCRLEEDGWYLTCSDEPLDRTNAGEPIIAVIADALRAELGSTHQALKTAMRWTGASERTVKSWLGEVLGARGEHVIMLMKRSVAVLEAMLQMAGRRHSIAGVAIAQLEALMARVIELIRPLTGPGQNSP